MGTVTRRLLATLAVTAALAVPASPGAAAPAAGEVALRDAAALAATWGRCPTARPAHRALAQAKRLPRSRRAPAALRARAAWRTVRAECSAPVALPTAVPSA